jgi:hypothetical protein
MGARALEALVRVLQVESGKYGRLPNPKGGSRRFYIQKLVNLNGLATTGTIIEQCAIA